MSGSQGHSVCTVPWTLRVLFLHMLLSFPLSPSKVSDLDHTSPPTMPKPSSPSLKESSLSPHLPLSAPTQPFQLSLEQICLNPSLLLPLPLLLKPMSMGFTRQGCTRDFSMVEADEGPEAGEFLSPDACLSLPLLYTGTMPWPCLGHHVSLGPEILHPMPLGCFSSTLGVQLDNFAPS